MSQAAAARFENLCRRAAADRGTCYVALAGGSTPKRLYEILAAAPLRERLPWQQLEVFFGDERAVPLDHADSNYRMAVEALLSRAPLPADQVHPMAPEPTSLEGDAGRYADLLAAKLPKTAAGVPRFDIILLGMGRDGHTASLFPGNAALAETRRWVTPVYLGDDNHSRLSLSYPVLNAARHLLVLVAGADKAACLAEVLAGEKGAADSPPIARLRPEGEMEWYLDAAAAEALQ